MLAQDYLLLAGGVAARPRAAAELARLQLAPAHAVPKPDFARTRDTSGEFWAVSYRRVKRHERTAIWRFRFRKQQRGQSAVYGAPRSRQRGRLRPSSGAPSSPSAHSASTSDRGQKDRRASLFGSSQPVLGLEDLQGAGWSLRAALGSFWLRDSTQRGRKGPTRTDQGSQRRRLVLNALQRRSCWTRPR